MSSFTTMDSASNYSFKIPHSSFLESYAIGEMQESMLHRKYEELF